LGANSSNFAPKHKDNEYCKICIKQSLQTETNKPIYGDIRDRKKQWNEELQWKPKGHSKEVPFIYVIDKLQIDFEKIEIKKLGWRDIPECHLKREKEINNLIYVLAMNIKFQEIYIYIYI
jgi:hypothetical protein